MPIKTVLNLVNERVKELEIGYDKPHTPKVLVGFSFVPKKPLIKEKWDILANCIFENIKDNGIFENSIYSAMIDTKKDDATGTEKYVKDYVEFVEWLNVHPKMKEYKIDIIDIMQNKNIGSSLTERKDIANTIKGAGFETYMTDLLWPRDAYIERNNIIIPKESFRAVGEGGNYVFTPNAIFANSTLKKNIDELLEKDKVKELFAGDIYYVNPSEIYIPNRDGIFFLPSHVDLFMNYVSATNTLCMDENFYNSNKEVIDKAAKEHNFNLDFSNTEELLKLHYYPNNFLEVKKDGKSHVFASETANFLDEKKVIVHKTMEIEALQMRGGSIHCATNTIDDLKILSYIGKKGISHAPYHSTFF